MLTISREQVKQYAIATLISLAAFLSFSLYLYLRRGYYNLYIANKAFGSAGLIVIGIVLLIGPLSRLYERFDPWLIYRKELGIVGFAFALLHALVSFFFLPDRFPLAGYFGWGFTPFLLGLSSLLLLIALFILSFEGVSRQIEKEAWWRWQYRGVRIAALLLFLHLVIMKYPGWLTWFTKGGSEELVRPYLPPGSLIAGSFGFMVLLVRLIEAAGAKIARLVTPLLLALLLVFWMGSLAWGKTKTPQALPLSWPTCLKLPKSKILESYPPVCVSPDGRRATQPIF
ncbi:MAG: ferric reductase-like transmembrane domain-containing protein [Patescibacteria group bacterium]